MHLAFGLRRWCKNKRPTTSRGAGWLVVWTGAYRYFLVDELVAGTISTGSQQRVQTLLAFSYARPLLRRYFVDKNWGF